MCSTIYKTLNSIFQQLKTFNTELNLSIVCRSRSMVNNTLCQVSFDWQNLTGGEVSEGVVNIYGLNEAPHINIMCYWLYLVRF